MKDGRIVSEIYRNNTDETTRFMAFSMTKSITSVLIGRALEEKRIASLDDPITKYLPEPSDGGYNGVTIRQILQMRSGVDYEERYDFANPGTAARNHELALVQERSALRRCRAHDSPQTSSGRGVSSTRRSTPPCSAGSSNAWWWQHRRCVYGAENLGAAGRRGRWLLHHGRPAGRRARVQWRGFPTPPCATSRVSRQMMLNEGVADGRRIVAGGLDS